MEDWRKCNQENVGIILPKNKIQIILQHFLRKCKLKYYPNDLIKLIIKFYFINEWWTKYIAPTDDEIDKFVD